MLSKELEKKLDELENMHDEDEEMISLARFLLEHAELYEFCEMIDKIIGSIQDVGMPAKSVHSLADGVARSMIGLALYKELKERGLPEESLGEWSRCATNSETSVFIQALQAALMTIFAIDELRAV